MKLDKTARVLLCCHNTLLTRILPYWFTRRSIKATVRSDLKSAAQELIGGRYTSLLVIDKTIGDLDAKVIGQVCRTNPELDVVMVSSRTQRERVSPLENAGCTCHLLNRIDSFDELMTAIQGRLPMLCPKSVRPESLRPGQTG